MTPMTICVDGHAMQVPTASWPAYQSQGATQGPCPEGGGTGKPNGTGKPVEGGGTGGKPVEGGGTGGKPVEGGGTGKPVATKITICHTPPENPKAPVTMQINAADLAAHLKHGDKQGPCTTPVGGKTLPK